MKKELMTMEEISSLSLEEIEERLKKLDSKWITLYDERGIVLTKESMSYWGGGTKTVVKTIWDLEDEEERDRIYKLYKTERAMLKEAYYNHPDAPSLVSEFRNAISEGSKKIEEKLAEAAAALSEAEALADKYEIPFESNVSPLWQKYQISNSKFAELPDFILGDYDIEFGGYDGWEHSMVC